MQFLQGQLQPEAIQRKGSTSGGCAAFGGERCWSLLSQREIALRTHPIHAAASTHYLFFGGLFPTVRSLLFPCDSGGHVEMDEMSERARENYLFARAVVGCDHRVPLVVAAGEAH